MQTLISPEGTIGQMPEEQVESALQAGFKMMTRGDLQRLYNRLFLAQKFFEAKHPKITNWRLPRGRGRW